MKTAAIVITALIAVSAAGIALRGTQLPTQAAARLPYCAPFDANLTQSNVEFLTMRVKRDPGSALDWNSLSSAYLQRARETGDLADAIRAEQAARKSIALRTSRNSAGYNVLARSLLTQHRFNDALTAAREADRLDPGSQSLGYLPAEVMIEIGDYDAARKVLAKAFETTKNAQGLALWARLDELCGEPTKALAMLGKATAMVDTDVDALPQTVAWFHMRQGNLLAESGQADDALAQYRLAVNIYPTDYRSMTCMARLCAGSDLWTDALAWAKRSADVVPTPETLGLERDALHALGREQEARNIDAMIDAVGRLEASQGTAYDRLRAIFEADHLRNTADAVKLAEGELRQRHDVYAYDTLAWCQYQNGQKAAAASTIKKALSAGTKDSAIYYHAGMIALGNGDKAAAKALLTQALENNPYFLPFGQMRAKSALKAIG